MKTTDSLRLHLPVLGAVSLSLFSAHALAVNAMSDTQLSSMYVPLPVELAAASQTPQADQPCSKLRPKTFASNSRVQAQLLAYQACQANLTGEDVNDVNADSNVQDSSSNSDTASEQGSAQNGLDAEGSGTAALTTESTGSSQDSNPLQTSSSTAAGVQMGADSAASQQLNTLSETNNPMQPDSGINMVNTGAANDGGLGSLFGNFDASSFASVLALGGLSDAESVSGSLISYQNQRLRDQFNQPTLGDDDGFLNGFVSVIGTDFFNALLGQEQAEDPMPRTIGYIYFPWGEIGDVEIPVIRTGSRIVQVTDSDQFF